MKKEICSICKKEIAPVVYQGKVVWTQGDNAEPINNGRCCAECNYLVVIPARMRQINKGEQDYETNDR